MGPPGSDQPEGAGRDGGGSEQRRAALAAAARERFVAAVRRAEGEIDLAAAALLIAAEEFTDTNVAAYLRRLDALGDRVRLRAAAARGVYRDPDEAALVALHDVLFEEEGFHGPDEGGYDHQDFFLTGALDRKRGLPIVLSVIYCEVASRAGLRAVGVNLPQHFMAQFRGEHTSVLVDPFRRGARVPAGARPMGVSQDRLPVASKKQTLARMLQNLKFHYVQGRPPQLMKALAAVERILVVAPAIDQVRDRGLILRGIGMEAIERARVLQRGDRAAAAFAVSRAAHFLGPAWFDLKLYARLAEGAPEAQELSGAADQLWRMLGRHN